MKNGKATESSGLVLEMVKSADEEGIDMITGLMMNQIIMEEDVPALLSGERKL